jgi:CyaY protein
MSASSLTVAEFNAATELVFDRIVDTFDASELDVDIDSRENVLEIHFDAGGTIVVNRHEINRELWLAAKTGGQHFRFENNDWIDTRSGEQFATALSRAVESLAGVRLKFE